MLCNLFIYCNSYCKLRELEGTRLMETLRSDKVRSSTIDDIVRNRFEELYVPSDGRDKE